MTFTNDILRISKKQVLLNKEISNSLQYALDIERLSLKTLYKQVFSQKILFESLDLIDTSKYYKSAVEHEITQRVREICDSISTGSLFKDAIIKDIKKQIKNEQSSYIDLDSFIDKLYIKVVSAKKKSKQKFYKFYKIVVTKLLSWKQSLRKILFLKSTQRLIINLLSTIERVFSLIRAKISRIYDLRAYLDLVLTPKNHCSVVISTKQILRSTLIIDKNNEKRIYTTFNPAFRV